MQTTEYLWPQFAGACIGEYGPVYFFQKNVAPTSSDNLIIKSSTLIEISRSSILVVEFNMVKIATNSMGLKATKTLQKTSAENRSSLTKIASGRRVNSAADDAAGLAISRKIQATTKSLNAGLRNTASAISALDASLSGISELQQISYREKTPQNGPFFATRSNNLFYLENRTN